ncbi:MAG TPA: right-handed parallel beta-helix repeat-containing protein, partial [Actinomycetota bacterium]|nr:right-handed parallel beta-helix repeat-containing protein [Actinomycetota bacterium]
DESVTARDNLFASQEIRIEPGDTVTWTNAGRRTHDVTADSGTFVSGDLFPRARFSHTFAKEGTYYYHCSFHGKAGKQGMWGVVVVGDPEPVEPDQRPRIDVPADYKTIQGAVDAAEPGSTIVVAPGTYRGEVVIETDDLILRGVDRYRTVLHGRDERDTGILVEGAAQVTIANLTVRNFVTDGISFVDSFRYTAKGIEAIDNRMHGIAATRSFEGVMRSSFAWGSGEAGFYVGDCMGCGALLDRVQARSSHTGIAALDATGVTIRDSWVVGNGVGIALVSAGGAAAPGRGALVVSNYVNGDRAPARPPLRSAETFGIPRGTGIWLAGVANAVVRANRVHDLSRYGILVSATASGEPPERNVVAGNAIPGAGQGQLAWDGAGSDNCFDGNEFAGVPAPPDIERFTCDSRPFTGEPYQPVIDDLATALPASLALETADPPEPDRPSCQKGKPGCRR